MFGSLGNIWLDHLQFPNLSSSNWISICHIYVNIQRKHRKNCECCLKGHKSLDSLCTVVKPLIVSLVRQRDQPNKGQGHLLSCCGQLKTKRGNCECCQLNRPIKKTKNLEIIVNVINQTSGNTCPLIQFAH